MFSVSACGAFREEYSCTGPDAENDAKLLVARKKKELGEGWTVRTEKSDNSYYFDDSTLVVVCQATPQKVLEIEAKYKENKDLPEFDSDCEYQYPYCRRTQNSRRQKRLRKPLGEYLGLEPLNDTEDDLPTPSSGGANKEGTRKRVRSDRNPGSPPTHNYWHGIHGRRWGGRGKKDDYKSWKSKRRTKYKLL